MTQQPDFSVIVTCYREERSIREFHQRLTSAMQSMDCSYEVLLINDYSPDGTLGVLQAIYKEDPNTTVLIDFCRNSGQAAAHTAGILAARGRALIFIDSDLQLDPEDIPKLASAYNTGLDLVGGRRMRRQDSFFRRVSSRAANFIIKRITGTEIRDIFCCFKIINAQTVKALGYGQHRLFRILEVMHYCPRCKELDVSHHPRLYDHSGWTYPRLLALMIDGIFITMGNPFRKILYCGLFLLLLTLLGSVLLTPSIPQFNNILQCTNLAAFLMTAIISLLLILCGIVGEYLFQLHTFLCEKPLYIIRTCWRKNEEGD